MASSYRRKCAAFVRAFVSSRALPLLGSVVLAGCSNGNDPAPNVDVNEDEDQDEDQAKQ